MNASPTSFCGIVELLLRVCWFRAAAAKVRGRNFKYLAEGKGAPVTARFGPDGITIVNPNRARAGAAGVSQTVCDRSS